MNKWTREQDALVAEKVVGWTRYKHSAKLHPSDNRTINGVLYCAPGCDGINGGSSGTLNVPPQYGTCPTAAMEVVETMRDKGFAVILDVEPLGRWRCAMGWHAAHADTMPEAVCRAALLAVGAEV